MAPREVTSVATPALTFTEGDDITLPATVTVSYNDGSTEEQPVTWSQGAEWISGAGTYTLTGTTASGLTTSAQITVAQRNFLRNGGFEDDDVSMWQRSGSALTLRATDDPRTGARSAHFWDGSNFSFTLSQTSAALPAGQYVATGALQGDDEGDTGTVRIVAASAADEQSAAFAMTGWRNWSTPRTSAVTVGEGGTITVTVSATLPAGAWGTIDDIALISVDATPADTAALDDALERAERVDRDAITPSTLAVLDDALEIARIVSGAVSPTAQKVDEAASLLIAALDSLQAREGVETIRVSPVAITVTDGDPIALPERVRVDSFNGISEQVDIEWAPGMEWIPGAGTYRIDGHTATGVKTTATITVTERNWLANPSFEDADSSAWSITGTGAAAVASSNASDGTRAVEFWADADYAFEVSQTVDGLPAGDYTLEATTQGDGMGEYTATLRGTSGDSTAEATLELVDWQEFRTAVAAPITVAADGAVTVRASFALGAGAWGTVDDFRLVRGGSGDVDASALTEARDRVADLARDGFTATSLAAADRAAARADIVAQASSPSQAVVDAAAEALEEALADLIVTDAASTAPARGVLSNDNGHDTGLADGAYTVSMNLWWGQNATVWRLYEDGELIARVPLTFGGLSPQAASVAIAGKKNGTYEYTGVLVNSRGETRTSTMRVKVTDANPGTPVLSHDNYDGDGTYTLTANLWWGTNATTYRFFEGNTVIAEGTLTAQTPGAQRATVTVTDAPLGTHRYRVEFSNSVGSTLSKELAVKVRG
ncbi:Ig-like domain-containing protein [Microbacterium sp. C7(2022)]|nr:Ig-like domain-containing protein [Microbacterium sp. C7(2022)]